MTSISRFKPRLQVTRCPYGAIIKRDLGHDRLRIHIQRVAIGVDRKCAINFKGGFDGSISRVDVVQIYIDDVLGEFSLTKGSESSCM